MVSYTPLFALIFHLHSLPLKQDMLYEEWLCFFILYEQICPLFCHVITECSSTLYIGIVIVLLIFTQALGEGVGCLRNTVDHTLGAHLQSTWRE